MAHRVALRQPVQRTPHRRPRLRRGQRPRLHRKHPGTPRLVSRSLVAPSAARPWPLAGDHCEFVRGERQHVTIAIEPNLDAFRTYGPPVSHRHDAATAAGDLTGAFSHAHPRLHTIPHRGRQLRDLGLGEPTADHQPGQRFHDRAPSHQLPSEYAYRRESAARTPAPPRRVSRAVTPPPGRPAARRRSRHPVVSTDGCCEALKREKILSSLNRRRAGTEPGARLHGRSPTFRKSSRAWSWVSGSEARSGSTSGFGSPFVWL